MKKCVYAIVFMALVITPVLPVFAGTKATEKISVDKISIVIDNDDIYTGGEVEVSLEGKNKYVFKKFPNTGFCRIINKAESSPVAPEDAALLEKIVAKYIDLAWNLFKEKALSPYTEITTHSRPNLVNNFKLKISADDKHVSGNYEYEDNSESIYHFFVMIYWHAGCRITVSIMSTKKTGNAFFDTAYPWAKSAIPKIRKLKSEAVKTKNNQLHGTLEFLAK